MRICLVIYNGMDENDGLLNDKAFIDKDTSKHVALSIYMERWGKMMTIQV